MTNHTKGFFKQWVDGHLQYDPIAGGRDGFATITVEYGSTEHVRIATFIETANVPGMVTEYRTETRGFRKRHWVKGPVTYDFEHRAYLMSAVLGGGAA